MTRRELTGALSESFSVEELRDICYNLGVDHELFPSRKPSFIRELVRYCERAGRIDDFLEDGRVQRPKVDWSSLS